MSLAQTGDDTFRKNGIHLILFALVAGYALLLGFSAIFGIWLYGPDGLPRETDFINVWAAGDLVLQGRPADAYDWEIHTQVEYQGVGKEFTGFFPWHYHPPFLMAAAVLALMPYPVAMLAWMAATLPVYAASVSAIVGRRGAVLAALAWPAVFWNVVLGQNGLLSAGLIGGGLLFIQKRPVLAGILFGLATYKPQFGILIPLALMAAGYWRTFFSAAGTAIALCLISWVVFGTETWLAFFTSTTMTHDEIMVAGRANIGELNSVYAFVRTLEGSVEIAWTLHGVAVLTLAALVIAVWHSDRPFDTKAAVLGAATILASPYVYVYDLVILAVPVAFMARRGFDRPEIVAVAIAAGLLLWSPVNLFQSGLVANLIVLALAVRRVMAQSESIRPAAAS